MNNELVIEHIEIEKLTPYKSNSKIHTKAQIQHIANSIKEFGFNDPLAIAGENHIVLEGNGRIEAAKLLGFITLPCVRLDHLTSEAQRAYVIAHNSLCLETGFDDAALFTELEQLKDYDFVDYGLNTEKFITTLDRLQRKELAPIQKSHYLISVDVNQNDKIIDMIVKLRGIDGVEVRTSCN